MARSTFDLHPARRIRCDGVTFDTRTIEDIREIFAGVKTGLRPTEESGKLKSPIARMLSATSRTVALTSFEPAFRQDRS